MKKNLLAAASCAVLALATSPASAQSIDYSTMEELFGEPVTTSANGSPQRQSEVSLNMEILTADEIARTGARTIPEALRFIPGVDVRRHTFGQYEVGIRGYNQPNAERILVLVNGRQVYTDYFGQVVWDGIPVEMSDIKQIEVVKGPNTALFGFNAVSGVVNIITYNPLYDDVKSATVSGGTHSFSEVSGTFSHKLSETIGVRVSAGGYKSTEDFNDVEDARSSSGADVSAAVDDSTRESFALDVWAQLFDNVQGNFEITMNDNVRNEILVTGGLSTTEYRSSSVRSRILADTDWGLWDFDVYHNESQGDYDLGLTTGTVPLSADNRITVAKLNNTFEVGADHIFRLAGEYRSASNIFSSTAASLDADDLNYDIWSVSGLWDWKATDTVRTSMAVRYDNFELEPDSGVFVAPGAIGTFNPSTDSDFFQKREEISYNFSATYIPDDINTYRFTTSRGADLPSFTEFGLQFFTPAGTAPNSGIYGDPNVDTSIVNHHEIGYDRKVPEINGLFRSAIFYQYNDEMQSFGGSVFSVAGPTDLAIITNIGDSEMYGLELGLEGVYQERWNWNVNYAYIEINDDLRNAQNSAERSAIVAYEDTVANHVLNAHVGYSEDKWRADVFAQYRTSFDDAIAVDATTNNEFALREVGDEFILNANFAYDITDMITWSVSGTSLFGDTQQTLDAEAETVVWSSLKFKF